MSGTSNTTLYVASGHGWSGFFPSIHMITRMVELMNYASGDSETFPGVFDIEYPPIRQQAIVIVHGHDEPALLQIKGYIRISQRGV